MHDYRLRSFIFFPLSPTGFFFFFLLGDVLCKQPIMTQRARKCDCCSSSIWILSAPLQHLKRQRTSKNKSKKWIHQLCWNIMMHFFFFTVGFCKEITSSLWLQNEENFVLYPCLYSVSDFFVIELATTKQMFPYRPCLRGIWLQAKHSEDDNEWKECHSRLDD